MRLIDADALERHVYTEWVNGELSNSEWVDFRQWLKDEPTVEAVSPWRRVEKELPEPNVQCLVRDNDCNYAVGYYRQDVKAWDSPFFGWLERDDEYYEDGDLCRIGKVVAWMPLPEPPKEDA